MRPDAQAIISIANRTRNPTKNAAVIMGVSGISCASTSSSSVTRYSRAAAPNGMTRTADDQQINQPQSARDRCVPVVPRRPNDDA